MSTMGDLQRQLLAERQARIRRQWLAKNARRDLRNDLIIVSIVVAVLAVAYALTAWR